jgi:hypothetical protein
MRTTYMQLKTAGKPHNTLQYSETRKESFESEYGSSGILIPNNATKKIPAVHMN